MKLKYYLRGMGIGIILTAIVMGFALGGRKATLSDAEIIQRAKALGMIEAESGTLSNTQTQNEEVADNDASTSDQTLDQEGKEISEEEQQAVTSSDNAVPEVAQEETEGEDENTESQDASSEDEGEIPPESLLNSKVTETVESEIALGTNETEVKNESAESTQEAAGEPSQSQQDTQPSLSGRTITIPRGLGSDQVAEILYNEGIVDNAVTFNRYLIDRGVDRIIRSGTKVIPEGSNYEQVANIITKG